MSARQPSTVGQPLMRLTFRGAAVLAHDCGKIRVGRKRRGNNAAIEDFKHTRVNKETCAQDAAA